MRVWPGKPYPLGANWDGSGVNFSLFSEHATGVELCLFDSPDAAAPAQRIPLREQTDQVWHGYLPDASARAVLWLSCRWPVRPAQMAIVSTATKLFSTRTRALLGRFTRWSDELFGYQVGHDDLSSTA